LRRGTTDRRQPRDAGIRGMTSGSSTVAGLTTSAPGWTKCALPTFKSIKKRRASAARSSLTSRCTCLNRLSKNRCLFDISIRVRKIANGRKRCELDCHSVFPVAGVVHSETELADQSSLSNFEQSGSRHAKVLTKDEARRIAVNIARRPGATGEG
jgi:hypothetical protein